MSEAFDTTMTVLTAEIPRVFDRHTVNVRRADPCTKHEDAVLASVGFGGAAMRGAFALLAPPAVWRALAPPEMQAAGLTDALLCDFVGEMANLLTGGFRRRLACAGIDVECGVPVAAYGRVALPQLPRASALHIATFCLETEFGSVELRADVLFDDAFVMPTNALARLQTEPEQPGLLLF